MSWRKFHVARLLKLCLSVSVTVSLLLVTPIGVFSRSAQPPSNWQPFGPHGQLTIIVLAMNRAWTLDRLLRSLERTDFHNNSVSLEIKFDLHEDQIEAIEIAERFQFSHGQKHISRANAAMGLAKSWFNAWRPSSLNDRAVILEDDIEVSKDWYEWLLGTWENYGKDMDIAGVSLMRQVLIAKKPHRSREIVNRHQPFKYALVGSIAFSPSPKVWMEFCAWLDAIEPDFDVSTPGLVTSEWWNGGDKTHMWTQHFIYFTLCRNMYTVYINLPNSRTLAAHLRAKGAHTSRNQGQDFAVGAIDRYSYPLELNHYGWDGRRIALSALERPTSALSILQQTMLHSLYSIIQNRGHVFLIFEDGSHVSETVRFAGKNENRGKVIVVASDYKVSRAILKSWPEGQVFAQEFHDLQKWSIGTVYKVMCPSNHRPKSVNSLFDICTCDPYHQHVES